jgi:trans-aconitate methyltransferase
MQTKEDLESWYKIPDQWGYFSNPEDTKRRDLIFSLLPDKLIYNRAIDIGCGEGFISQKIPARTIHGLDLATNALGRLPENVVPIYFPHGKYDLVVSTGTLYQQYDHKSIYDMIMKFSSNHILISGISDWLINYDFGEVISTIEFPYREFNQRTTLYRIK